MALPLVVLVSRRTGHASIGEAGRLNYVWFVNGLQPYVGWTGEPAAPSGTPEHPPRSLLERPLVLEFASPLPGTYPLWYDPSYWYAGIKIRFDLKQQRIALKNSLIIYLRAALQMGGLVAGAVRYVCSRLTLSAGPRPSEPTAGCCHGRWRPVRCMRSFALKFGMWPPFFCSSGWSSTEVCLPE